ncbi:EAL domain-containing protein [Thioalkalivibrio sulfidiphilus]|uniref:EAL domain-containing protein n=1 Tax=Thioalkalivibrio sulfidiphilus TaxID=1033854 RepID=UPI00035CD38D|nr:EAL domain-containing protein [Thioalkalivibrio sulfidiphilus]
MPASNDNLRFRLIFEQALDPMILVDRHGGIVEANRSACASLGYSHEELVGGLHVTDFDLNATREDVERVHGNPERYLPASFQSTYRRKDGSTFPAEVHLNAVWVEDQVQVFATFLDISERLAAERTLREREHQLRTAITSAPMVLFSLDRHGTFTLSEGKGLEGLGLAPGQAVGMNALEMYGTYPEVAEGLRRALSGEPVQLESRVEGRCFLHHWQPVPDEAAGGWGVLGVSYDITAQRLAEQALSGERDRLFTTLESIADGVITADVAGRVAYMNPVAEQLTGFTLSQARGRPMEEILRVEDLETGELMPDPVERCFNGGSPVVFSEESRLRRPDGESYAVRLTVSPLRDGEDGISGAVLVLHDFSMLWDMARQLSHQARHDALTGLINRREFEERVREALESARRSGRSHALCYIDLDQFKVVNDTCGHVAGDELLRQLAAALPRHIRDTDTLARLGGDEFGLLLENCPLDRALSICHQLLAEVAELRFMWEGRRFDVGMSIGLVSIDGTSASLSEVLSEADSACYVAKEQGRNRVYVSRPGDQALKTRYGEMEWLGRIREAMEEERFELFCQPIRPISGEGVSHFEILLRLKAEDGSLVEPGAFIPAAERYNLMPQVDRHVIRSVFAMLADSDFALKQHAIVGINLSGQSLGQEDLLDFVTEALQYYGMPAHRFCFEITETAAIANLSSAAGFIRELRDMGCAFALDDFGSGLSSFNYLKHMPVDYLKIDGSFVQDVLTDPVDAAMVGAIHRIGRVLGVKTIAEFVESEAVLEHLREIGVDYAQGYGIGRPTSFRTCGLFQTGRD